MPTNEKTPETGGSRITGLDISKNVAAALVIAFLTYWLPIIAEQFYSPTEVRYHHAKLGDLSGYIFSIQNFSWRQIDDLSIFIDAQIGRAYQDGAVSLEVTPSSNPTMIKLKNVAPHTDATLFVTIEKEISSGQIRISSSSTITVFEDTKFIKRDFWSPSTFFSSIFTAALYLTLGLYTAGQRRHMQFEAASLRREMKTLDEKSNQVNQETEKKFEDVNWRLMRARVHMLRQVTRLTEEVNVWRRFFRQIYSTTFGAKSDAESALELLLKLSGVHVIKGIRDYSEAEFLNILDEADRNRLAARPDSKE